MRVTIVKADNAVYVDGVALKVECSDLPRYFHAVQWYDTYGEVEFVADADGVKMPNMKISDFSPFQAWIDRHAQAKAVIEARLAEQAANNTTPGGMHAFEE